MSEPRLAGRRNVDISGFTADLTAAERKRMIAEKFPSTQSLDWGRAFANDIELLGRLLGDMLKVNVPPSGRPGPRPNLDRDTAMPDLDQLLGEDPTRHPYAVLPFAQIFCLLVGKRSVRALQSRFGMSKTHVHDLLRGKVQPTQAEMELVAASFGKQPGYFAEYRANKIATFVGRRMAIEPDYSIRVYEGITHAASK